jgi:hypothetical protein
MEDEENAFDMPEETAIQIVDKIYALAVSIRSDWSDPRGECRKIWDLCDKLKTKIAPQDTKEAVENIA